MIMKKSKTLAAPCDFSHGAVIKTEVVVPSGRPATSEKLKTSSGHIFRPKIFPETVRVFFGEILTKWCIGVHFQARRETTIQK